MEADTPACLPKNDIHLAKRTQAIRMNRRGESAATIAGALEVPRNEVELLLKVATAPRQSALSFVRSPPSEVGEIASCWEWRPSREHL